MQKRYEVFVSSTRLDLDEERSRIRNSIVRSGNVPTGMEDFSPRYQPALETITDAIRTCDYYILIVGDRYGTIEPKSGLSYTEIEFDFAQKLKKPTIAFLKTDIGPQVDNREHLEAFRRKVTKKQVVWWHEGELISKFAEEMPKIIAETPVTGGWVPAPAYEKLEGDLKTQSFLRDVYTYLFNKLNPYDDIQLIAYLREISNERLDSMSSVQTALAILLKNYVDQRVPHGTRAYFAYRIERPKAVVQDDRRFKAYYRLAITSSSEGKWYEGVFLSNESNVDRVYKIRDYSAVRDARRSFANKRGENHAVADEGSVIGAPVMYDKHCIGVVGLSSRKVGEVTTGEYRTLAGEIRVIFSAIFYAYAGLISRNGVRRVTYQRLRTDIARHFDHFLGTQSRG